MNITGKLAGSFMILEAEEFFAGLNKADQPTAYIFRCLHCNPYLAFVDET